VKGRRRIRPDRRAAATDHYIYSSELYQTVLPVCATELQPHIRNENEHTGFSQQYG
jgi:hypothetical protein